MQCVIDLKKNAFTALSFIILLLSLSIQADSPRDRYIGYTMDDLPVPASAICLDPQAVLLAGTMTTIYRGTAADTSVAVNPLNDQYIVAAWIQSVISNEGALEVGIARSKNGGHHWTRQTISFQDCIGGFIQRVSDVWLSYGSEGTLYLSALVFNATLDTNTLSQSGVVVAVSKDNGESWSNPHWVVASQNYLSEPTKAFPVDDKPSITADLAIPLNAYCVWDRFPTAASFHSDTLITLTTDGGTTWSPHQTLYNPSLDSTLMSNGIANDCQTFDNVVVTLPLSSPRAGDLLNFMVRIYAKPEVNGNPVTDAQYIADIWPFKFTNFDIAVVRSQDGGITWGTQAKVIATLPLDPLVFTGGYKLVGGNLVGIGSAMRTGNLEPSFSVNPVNGYLYAVWQTGMFREDQLPQIALSTSRDGGVTWSTPVKVSQTPKHCPNPQAFTPFVSVDGHGYVGVLYSDFRKSGSKKSDKTKTNTWLAVFKETNSPTGGSTGVGLDFKKEHRLSNKSYIAQNGPITTLGIMTNGDYSFLDASDKRFYAVYTQSFKGPFADSELMLSVADNVTLYLDDNLRTAPFFSRVKGNSK